MQQLGLRGMSQVKAARSEVSVQQSLKVGQLRPTGQHIYDTNHLSAAIHHDGYDTCNLIATLYTAGRFNFHTAMLSTLLLDSVNNC